MMIRFSLLLRYVSCKTYRLLLEQLPLPLLSLLKEIKSGTMHSMKTAKLLLKQIVISLDCVSLREEIYL